MLPRVELLPGEAMDVSVASSMEASDAVAVLYTQHDKTKPIEARWCSLMLSSYRLVLGVVGAAEPIVIPLMAIHSWKAAVDVGPARDAFRAAKQRAAKAASSPPPASAATTSTLNALPQAVLVVSLTTKHVWTLSFAFAAENERLLRIIRHHLFECGRITHVQQLPAFAISAAAKKLPSPSSPARMDTVDFGWNIHDQAKEFERQLCLEPSEEPPSPAPSSHALAAGLGIGQDLRPWFHLEVLGPTTDPSNYSSCPTYPTAVLVPNAVPRSIVLAAMTARSRARIPAIAYVHLATGAVLARASQPLSGSSNVGADAALCAALANAGYPHSHTAPNESVRPLTVAAPAAHPPSAASSPKAAAATTGAPPPPLFDEDEDVIKSREARRLLRQDTVKPPAAATAAAASGDTIASAPPQERQPQQAPASRLMVADCRPWVTAKANATFGGGYESGPFYDPFCNTQFFEIDNVFGIAKSFDKLRALVRKYQGDDSKYTYFWRDLEDTKWFLHLQRVLICSIAVANSLRKGVSALVHCTDGWDRTSQCCATAELLLDPFFRTTVGFCVLLQKEFGHFGHKFAERSDHQVGGRTSFEVSSGVANSDTEKAKSNGDANSTGAALQPSPIFTQYMDVVYQIMHQLPHSFEFTPALLAFLSEAIFSCFYGTFLCNCEQERRLEGVELATESVWTFILRQVQKEKAGEAPLHFLNDRYDARTAWAGIQKTRVLEEDGRRVKSQQGEASMLMPSTSLKRMRFWSELYCKWDPGTLPPLPEDGCASAELPSLNGAPPRTQKVSWGEGFDAFLQQHIDAACSSRLATEEQLRQLETLFVERPTHCKSGRRTSEWCVFDAGTCSNCLRSIGMFSAGGVCSSCGRGFCSNCISSHGCVDHSAPG